MFPVPVFKCPYTDSDFKDILLFSLCNFSQHLVLKNNLIFTVIVSLKLSKLDHLVYIEDWLLCSDSETYMVNCWISEHYNIII